MSYDTTLKTDDRDVQDEDQIMNTDDDFGIGFEGGGGEIAEDNYDDESDADSGAESTSDDSIEGVIV